MPDAPAWLTVSEVGQVLAPTDPALADHWVRSGQLPAAPCRECGCLHVATDDLATFIAERLYLVQKI